MKNNNENMKKMLENAGLIVEEDGTIVSKVSSDTQDSSYSQAQDFVFFSKWVIALMIFVAMIFITGTFVFGGAGAGMVTTGLIWILAISMITIK